jgi:integrase
MAETEFQYDADLIHTATWTGMRAGEVIGLQWSDIDFHQRFAQIQCTVGYRKGSLNVMWAAKEWQVKASGFTSRLDGSVKPKNGTG